MTDQQFPFSAFEYLGYIVPGVVVLVGIFLNYGPLDSFAKLGEYLSSIKDASFAFYAALLLSAYVLGHIVSALGSFVFERQIVHRFLGYPSENLFRENAKPSRVFREYLRPYSLPFSREFRKIFVARFGSEYETLDQFLLCLHDVKERMPTTYNRLERFIRLYDFARNLAMGFILLAAELSARAIAQVDLNWFGSAALSVGLAFALFLRYLRFFRSYSDEVFRSFFILHFGHLTNRQTDPE